MTLGAFFILCFAVSLPVTYMSIIHRSLSGGAANDPNHDVNAPVAKSAPVSHDVGHRVPSHA